MSVATLTYIFRLCEGTPTFLLFGCKKKVITGLIMFFIIIIIIPEWIFLNLTLLQMVKLRIKMVSSVEKRFFWKLCRDSKKKYLQRLPWKQLKRKLSWGLKLKKNFKTHISLRPHLLPLLFCAICHKSNFGGSIFPSFVIEVAVQTLVRD